jgi:NAD(P)-dependent dehydrogenase (short-subunit alcohol dehydrogenase family)
MSPPSNEPVGADPSVFITGCSVGVGHAAALLMVREGWRVFAGVRKLADGESLQAESGGAIEPVLCDVRDRKLVGDAARQVSERLGDAGLDGLVCNAGVGSSGPVEFLDAEALALPIESNLYGSIYCTQAFLPLLRIAKGRIVFVTSGSVLFTMPLMSTYPASKLALEQLGPQLQTEVARFGIHVSVVDPGHIRSRMTLTATAASAAARAKLPPEAGDLYGDLLDDQIQLTANMEGTGIEPEVSAQAYLRALTDTNPKPFYIADARIRWFRRLAKYLPDGVKTAIARGFMGS